MLYLKLTNREKVSRYVEKRASIDMKKYAMVYDREIGLGVRGKMNKLWGYAAAILVLCVIGVTIWMNELKQNEANQLAQVTIEPGRAKALLVLDDGQEIELDDHKTSKVLEESGIVIVNDSSRVEYRPALRMGEKEVMNKIIVPTGGEYNLILSDGTRVYLNAESVITFPKHFTGERREVTLEGEAYFDVHHDPVHPFYVKTKSLDVKVLGTSFNVKAYRNASIVETSLVEGVVSVKDNVLRPDMQATYHEESGDFSYRKIKGENYRLRKEQMFVFEEERLDDILQEMARWYDFEVFYRNPEMAEKRFGFKLEKYEHVDSLLKILELTGEVKFEMNGKTLIVKGVG